MTLPYFHPLIKGGRTSYPLFWESLLDQPSAALKRSASEIAGEEGRNQIILSWKDDLLISKVRAEGMPSNYEMQVPMSCRIFCRPNCGESFPALVLSVHEPPLHLPRFLFPFQPYYIPRHQRRVISVTHRYPQEVSSISHSNCPFRPLATPFVSPRGLQHQQTVHFSNRESSAVPPMVESCWTLLPTTGSMMVNDTKRLMVTHGLLDVHSSLQPIHYAIFQPRPDW